MPSLTALAEEALVQAKLLDGYLAAEGRPITSFKDDTLFDLPPNLADARDNLVNATQTLNRLALGPVGVLLDIMWSVCVPSMREMKEVSCSHLKKLRLTQVILVHRSSLSRSSKFPRISSSCPHR